MNLLEAGASVSASSGNSRHPIQNLVTKKAGTEKAGFYSSTGMFPLDIVIHLSGPAAIDTISIVSTGIQRLEVAKSENSHSNSWETISNVSLKAEESASDLQRINVKIPNVLAIALRFRVLSSWDHFIILHHMFIGGTPTTTLIDGSPAPLRK